MLGGYRRPVGEALFPIANADRDALTQARVLITQLFARGPHKIMPVAPRTTIR